MAYAKELWVKLRTMYETGQYESIEEVHKEATRLLQKVPIAQRIRAKAAKEGWIRDKHQPDIDKKVLKKAEINTKWVVDKAVTLVDRCMQHEPVLDNQGNETGEYKFDSAGVRGGLQLLSNHTGGFDKNVQKPISINILQVNNNMTIEQINGELTKIEGRLSDQGPGGQKILPAPGEREAPV